MMTKFESLMTALRAPHLGAALLAERDMETLFRLHFLFAAQRAGFWLR